jgi:hypothetical protein
MAQAPKVEGISLGDIATWTRERTAEEIHGFLGQRMAALALENVDIEDGEEAGLYDLMTV